MAQITGANSSVFSYDANGDSTAIDALTFIHNKNKQLIRVEEGLDNVGQYAYNGSR